MRDASNISKVIEAGADMIGMIFCPESPRCISDQNSMTGHMPDLASIDTQAMSRVTRVGVFVNQMPQTVIHRVVAYHLDCIQLHGNESPTYIDNLRSTLVPDIVPDIRIIKALSIREADDVKRWRDYQGHADMLLFDTRCECRGGSGQQFDWDILSHYDGNIPFLLSGGIGPQDAERVKAFAHPRCIGIDVNSRFETAPAIKDAESLKVFIQQIRQDTD